MYLVSRQLESGEKPPQHPYGGLEHAHHPGVVERQVVSDPVPGCVEVGAERTEGGPARQRACLLCLSVEAFFARGQGPAGP